MTKQDKEGAVKLIFWVTVVAMVILILCNSCAGGPQMIPGPDGKPIMAPPEGMTYDAGWHLVPVHTQPKPANMTPLYAIGAGGVLGGAVVAYLIAVPLGLLLSCSGIGLIAAVRFLDLYPWAVWIPFGLCVTGLCYAGYSLWRGKRAQAALTAIVPAVESQGANLSRLKEDIERRAGSNAAAVKGAITQTKTKLGL